MRQTTAFRHQLDAYVSTAARPRSGCAGCRPGRFLVPIGAQPLGRVGPGQGVEDRGATHGVRPLTRPGRAVIDHGLRDEGLPPHRRVRRQVSWTKA